MPIKYKRLVMMDDPSIGVLGCPITMFLTSLYTPFSPNSQFDTYVYTSTLSLMHSPFTVPTNLMPTCGKFLQRMYVLCRNL